MNQTKNKEKYYNALHDLVFKNALCTEENKYLLKWLIEKIIDRKIDKLTILNNERPVSSYNKKGRTLDVLAETEDEVFNIELNSTNYSSLSKRNAGYLMNCYVEDLERGDSYSKMRHYIQINFTKGLSKRKRIKEVYTISNLESGENYIENFTIIEYNIDKLVSYYFGSEEERKIALEYNYVLMLALGGSDLKKICKGEKHMERFRENVDKLNKDEKMRLLFSAEEDAIRTHNTLVEESIEKGEKAKATQIAKNMLAKNTDINFICEVTGLNKKEILALK